MIRGEVDANLQAKAPLKALGRAGQVADLTAIIDTGFSDFLSLPPAIIRDLGFEFEDPVTVILADGSETVLDTYAGRIEWDNRELRIVVIEADGDALIGMSLLRGHRLQLDVGEHGPLLIDALTA
jgi:clan AA aspartic protease